MASRLFGLHPILQIGFREAFGRDQSAESFSRQSQTSLHFEQFRLAQQSLRVRDLFQLRDRRQTFHQVDLPLIGKICTIAARGGANQRSV